MLKVPLSASSKNKVLARLSYFSILNIRQKKYN